MKIRQIGSYLLAILTFVLITYLIIINQPSNKFNIQLYLPYSNFIFNGFIWTIFISIISFFLSFCLGFLMFFASKSKHSYLRSLVDVYTNIMFGTPLLVVVIIFYFFIGAAIDIDSVLFWGMTSMTMYFAPFMMKLFISAFRAIDENQFIVCDIFGFSKFQMYRYIIIPQMLKIMLPPLSGQLSIIIKGSSLLYVTGFNELFYNLSTIQSKTYAYPEGYILIMVLYLFITIPLIKVTEYLERRLTV